MSKARTTTKAKKANGASKTGNGAQAKKPTRRRKPAPPEIPESHRKLTLKGFRLAYEAHNRKGS